MSIEVWFWQRIVSPHMAGLAVALARRGVRVSYVAESEMSGDRKAQGWLVPSLTDVRLILAPTEHQMRAIAMNASDDAVHICQGVRGNGLVGVAQQVLSHRGVSQWVVMETVDPRGVMGVLRRFVYRRQFSKRKDVDVVLAIGSGTEEWLMSCGVDAKRLFPFAYFLPEYPCALSGRREIFEWFRFLFVGRLIHLKRLDLLINAMAKVSTKAVLTIVGAGPKAETLRRLAKQRLHDRVEWVGGVSMAEVPDVMSRSDCLVLPSDYDGWGAVVSEALMCGTPVICSDACGAADVVKASGLGGVFPARNARALASLLAEQVRLGPLDTSKRKDLVAWAKSLGAEAGAEYMLAIIGHVRSLKTRPLPPWLRNADDFRSSQSI